MINSLLKLCRDRSLTKIPLSYRSSGLSILHTDCGVWRIERCKGPVNNNYWRLEKGKCEG